MSTDLQDPRGRRPLFDWAPELVSRVPWRPLADLPTPVQRLSLASNAWIKRDDVTHTEYGGNKIRKLEFIIADALARGAQKIVTFGATGTNHGVATAMMCQRVGLACEVLLFDQPDSPTVRMNQSLMRHYGAQLVYCGSLGYTVMRYYLHPDRLRRGNYFLFAGGSNVAGTLGFVNAAFEIRQQVADGIMAAPATVVCPVGSSATLAGLTLGFQWAGMPVKVIGVRVAPSHLGPFAACTTDTVSALMQKTRRHVMKARGMSLPLHEKPVLLDEYYGDGYGVGASWGEAAKARFAREGHVLEQTYSAKAAACFLDQVDASDLPVLFWQTFNSRPVPGPFSASSAKAE
jgi:1-aminocyclopropane-1-carboxylate deaminase/D-cysteine desulfhydrase-like pyridoxal-dependent ACC family enzyme